jgi:hypothetical protein
MAVSRAFKMATPGPRAWTLGSVPGPPLGPGLRVTVQVDGTGLPYVHLMRYDILCPSHVICIPDIIWTLLYFSAIFLRTQ